MIKKYPKIQTVFKRDMANKGKIISGIYSLPEIEYLKDNIWGFTEKVDGTNIRIDWKRDEYCRFGGRTDNAQIPVFLLRRLEELFSLEKLNAAITETDALTLYGEGYGARIQKGGGNYHPDRVDFVLFDVLVDDWWLKREDVDEVAEVLSIKLIPFILEGPLSKAIEFVSNGFNSTWGNFQAEGLVMRPKVELKTRAGHRIITKIKCKDFK